MEEYLQLAREVISETRKEKGFIKYTLHEDINESDYPYHARRMGG
ncbi:hypothetical protein [Neobacillus drentensis]